MKKVLVLIISIVLFGCEQSANESLIGSLKKNELKQEQFTFNYEGCKIYGKVLPVDALTRGFSSMVKVYDLVVESEYLKKEIVTQLTQTFNNDGSFTLAHYVEGVKVATLYYNVGSGLSDIVIENHLNTKAATSFSDCVAKKICSIEKGHGRKYNGDCSRLYGTGFCGGFSSYCCSRLCGNV